MTPELQAKFQKAATTEQSSDQTGTTNLIQEHGSELQLLSQASISVTKLQLSLLRNSRSYHNAEMIKHLLDAAKSNEG